MDSLPRASACRVAALACLTFEAAFAAGCASYGFNYLHPRGPRCAAELAGDPAPADPGQLEIASFNVKFGQRPDQALATLRRGGLDDADILLLQEMDLPSTIEIARDLGFNYVYYPAAVHPATRRQFGLAILSPWPIRDDRKLNLPMRSGSDDAQKIALAATVWARGIPIGVINVHLQSGLTPVQLGDHLQKILRCVMGKTCHETGAPFLPDRPYYVMAGDFNTSSGAKIDVMREVARWGGFEQVPGMGRTHKYLTNAKGRLDHILVTSGLRVDDSGQVGGFFKTGSDHRPIWTRVRLAPPASEPWRGFDRDAAWPAGTSVDARTCRCDGLEC